MKILTKTFVTSLVLAIFLTAGLNAAGDHDHDHDHDHDGHDLIKVHTKQPILDKDDGLRKQENHEDHDHHDDHEKHGAHDDHEEKEGIIKMDSKTLKEFGVKISTARSGFIQKTKLFPGEIQTHIDYLAHITPRFPGVVKKIFRHIGDDVKKGDLLAIVESNDSLTPYKITSPISGTIIEKHITIGESIGENTHAFEVANLNTVWAVFSIYQDKFGQISPGQKAIVISSDGLNQVEGKVSYISPTVDQNTRTQKGRMVLNNKSRQWKPGMFVDVNVVFSEQKGEIVIPKTAIQRLEENFVVFVKNGDEFKPYPVQIGDSDHQNIVIISGLPKGSQFVSDGGFVLKAELKKGDLGHGGHAH